MKLPEKPGYFIAVAVLFISLMVYLFIFAFGKPTTPISNAIILFALLLMLTLVVRRQHVINLETKIGQRLDALEVKHKIS